MSESGDDLDDSNNIYDQLRSIRPFTVDQLFNLFPNIDYSLISTKTSQDDNSRIYLAEHDQVLYENLVEYEDSHLKLNKLKQEIQQMRSEFNDIITKIWTFKHESFRKIGMCQQGKIAEINIKYKQAFIETKKLSRLDSHFDQLIDLISKDSIYYSFESQVKLFRIKSQLSQVYKIEDDHLRSMKLRTLICTLIDFIKHIGDTRSEFLKQCHGWLRALIQRYLEDGKTDDYRFVISQLCKGPAKTSLWSADLLECKPFEKENRFDSASGYIAHCCTLLTELFWQMKNRLSKVITVEDGSESNSSTIEDYANRSWALVDPRFIETENVDPFSMTRNIFSEVDVINYCLRVPVVQIFKNYVQSCLQSENFTSEPKSVCENLMLEFLTLGTIIIKTYQIGLETFDKIQFGNLTDYLSHQIRLTVIVLSDQWKDLKHRLKNPQDLLTMRLQVEYDNFILRSILIILELRQNGIWRHLSARHDVGDPMIAQSEIMDSWSTKNLRSALDKLTGYVTSTVKMSSVSPTDSKNVVRNSPLTREFSTEWFKEVSEPMLWHILWQFYHNAFISSCDYHSDNYWLEKFKGKSVVYLFIDKIRYSSSCDRNFMLNSITNMLLSRSKRSSKLIDFIASEIFFISFKQESTKEKVIDEGTKCLIRSAERFPHLITLFVNYMDDQVDHRVYQLIRDCSLNGWMSDFETIELISHWLIEYPLDSYKSKVARLLISKLVINSPQNRPNHTNIDETQSTISESFNRSGRFMNLQLRRKFALIIYEASVRQSKTKLTDSELRNLSSSIEQAVNSRLDQSYEESTNHLLELATSNSYHSFYLWAWLLNLNFELHILNQLDTDWNDIKAPSGTSRSVKNTVLLNDSFHPSPSIQDSECQCLSDGVNEHNPLAQFINLALTDVSWQSDKVEVCLEYLNRMASLGYLTPSLMAMKFFTICHLGDLSTIVDSPKIQEFFTTIISSSLDSGRLASIISYQMDRLKQYRQLQLSHFYIRVLLNVANVKLQSSSWFFGDELSQEKIATLLDYIVKFNFTTQRLEIIHKFFDSSFSLNDQKTTNGWLSFLTINSSSSSNSSNREFLTILHYLSQKFKNLHWLRWVTTECDSLRLEKIWEDLVTFLSTDESSTLDSALKKVCPQLNPVMVKSLLPIYSWMKQIFDMVELDLSHPLCPAIWYNFFLNYFTNSLNGVSVGVKLVNQEKLTFLLSRLDSLQNYHSYKRRDWNSDGHGSTNSLAQLYRAYKLWLQDGSLQGAYIDMDRLGPQYMVPLLKSIVESSSTDSFTEFINLRVIHQENYSLGQTWIVTTRIKKMSQEKSDSSSFQKDPAISSVQGLEARPNENITQTNSCNITEFRSFGREKSDITHPPFKVFDERQGEEIIQTDDLMRSVEKNFSLIIKESSIFNSNIEEVSRIRTELGALIQQLYFNKKKEYVRTVSCSDGLECLGPAKIKYELEEATIDDRKSECIQDRQNQCDTIINDLLLMPEGETICSSITIEDSIRYMIKQRSEKTVIESVTGWIKDKATYDHLSGTYYAANHLLKVVLELLSLSEDRDTFNNSLLEICSEHPSGVQVFSPHFNPSSCTQDCFLGLYQKISELQHKLGPIATFVLLSKFDLNSWFNRVNDDKRRLAVKATCLALRNLGKIPDESFNLTSDIYRRHLKNELRHGTSNNLERIHLVFEEFLDMMDDQSLALNLWSELLNILGLDSMVGSGDRAKHSVENLNQKEFPDENIMALHGPKVLSTYSKSAESIIENVMRFAENQRSFDYGSINKLMLMMLERLNTVDMTSEVTLIELYQDYLEQFSSVLMGVTFIWLKMIGDDYPDNHELIWKQFMNLWNKWVFLTKNCQNVDGASYSLISNCYISSVRFMIDKIPDNTQSILRSVLSTLAENIFKTEYVYYLELYILQNCMRSLPWSCFQLTVEDFENVALLSKQDKYNVSQLVSHILVHIDMKNCLNRIRDSEESKLPRVAECLATSIVFQSQHLKGLRLEGDCFHLISIEGVSAIEKLILARMEFANLEHSQTNKLLVNLLRLMCIRVGSSSSISSDFQDSADTLERSSIYAHFISSYLCDLISKHPSVIKKNVDYLGAVMENSLQDLKILNSADVDITKKIVIYENLFECLNSNAMVDEDSRTVLADLLISSAWLKGKPIVMMEILYVLGHVISDSRVLVRLVEKIVPLYLNTDGHYEKVCKSFILKALPSELYLETCARLQAPLALLVYFEALTRGGHFEVNSKSIHSSGSSGESLSQNDIIWTCFFHWLSQLSGSMISEGQIVGSRTSLTHLEIAWLRFITLLETELNSFLNDHDNNRRTSLGDIETQPIALRNHKALLDFIERLMAIYDAKNSFDLWSYLKSTRSDGSNKTGLVSLAIASFLADRSLSCLWSGTISGLEEEFKSRSSKSSTPTHLANMRVDLYRLRKSCISKLDAARKSRQYTDCIQFIEALIETVNRNDLVQYSEGVQLIVTFVKSHSSNNLSYDSNCINKILPT